MFFNNFCKNTEKLYKRYQNQIKARLSDDTNYNKDSDISNFITTFKEKIINSIMGNKLNILISDIFIDNECIKNQMVIIIPQNHSKNIIPKYIITDAGNYSESEEDTRLRSISIILTHNCELMAVIIGCGKTAINCHSKHEYYGLINALMGLKYLQNNISKNTIWINDISDPLGVQFLKDNNINVKYKSSNSFTSNFAYTVMIKGICDSLLHYKQIFTHIVKGQHEGYIPDHYIYYNKYYTPMYKRNISPKIIYDKPKMTFTSIETIEDKDPSTNSIIEVSPKIKEDSLQNETLDFEDFLNAINSDQNIYNKKSRLNFTSIEDETTEYVCPTNIIEQLTPSCEDILYDLILLKNKTTLQIKFANALAFQNIKLSNIKSEDNYLFESVYIKDTILIQDSILEYISKDILIADTIHLKNIKTLREFKGFLIVNKVIIENCPLFDISNFINHYPQIKDIHYIK